MRTVVMNVIGNMLFDTILIAIMVCFILMAVEWDTIWKVISLVGILMLYGTIHGYVTAKRLGYRG